MLRPNDIAAFSVHILETPNNMLIDEVTLRPLQPKMKLETLQELSSPVCYANSSDVREEFRDENTVKTKDKPN